MTNTNKIEYRLVTAEEKIHLAGMQNLVFALKLEEKKVREDIEKDNRKHIATYGAIDGNGRVLAGFEAIAFTMWFDGHRVPMCGIGGVASLPESRRQGNIRGVFEASFEDMHQNGTVFSHLYPFSHDYYRKFGYEACGAAKKYTLPIAAARKLKSSGTAHEYVKGDEVRGKLIEVYEAFASRHNIMVSRANQRWDDVFDVKLFGSERLYYWRNTNSDIKSWAKLIRDNEKIIISDIVWLDHEGMLGILQFIGMFEGAAEKMVFTSSPELIAELYWNNLYDIKIEPAWLGMNRVVNAELALKLIKKPDGEGRFSIKVVDGFAKWNNNTYSVEYGSGECEVRKTEQGADIEVSERALMQMILGVYELEQLAFRDDVTVNRNMALLKKVFFKKNLLITDHF